MALRSNLRLVSFDGGGGARTFSQLRIMGQIMHQLSYDKYPNQADKIMLPCEHFDLMGGSGTGGLIAIMFARLRMSVEEASDEFFTIVEEVYKPHNLDPSERTRKLRECMEDTMKRKGLPVNLKLMENPQPGHCTSFVVASPRTNAANKVCLRTYPLRNQLPSTITIVEAVMATCATQPTFSSVTSGSSYNKKEYVGPSFGATNPVREVITEAHSFFGGDSGVGSLLSLGTGHPGIISFPSGGGIGLHDLMRDMMSDCEQRAQEIERQIGRVGIYFRFSVEQGMQRNHLGPVADPSEVVAQTEGFIADHKIREQIGGFLRSIDTATRLVTLDQLEYAGGAKMVIQSPPTLEAVLAALASNHDNDILAKLNLADLECHQHTVECMEGTRQDILARIDTWMIDFNAPNILWLKGHPGVGKSAIASSIVGRLRASERLGSHFFFQRQRANGMTAHALWRTVAYDLARRYPSIRKCLLAALSADETIPTIANVDTLFRQLVQEPFLANEEIPTESSPIIVLDAIDECGGLDGQYSEVRRSLIRTLKSWSGLPRKFKLIMTSRIESDIERVLSRTDHRSIEILAGQRVDSQSSEDIETFLAHEFQQIAAGYHRSLTRGWPGARTVKELSTKAAGLFIWAKTVIKYIAIGEPQRRLSHVLEGGGTGDIGALYRQILDTSFLDPTEEDISSFHAVVGTIILAKAPLSFLTLTHFLSMENSAVEHICNGLQSVLDSREVLQFHHQSFVDFLIYPSQSTSKFSITRQQESRVLTQACLRVMNETLRFNICGLESSHILNIDIPDLSSRERQHIPPHLSYSCSWWASHLAETDFDDEIFRSLEKFMQRQFLFWLEVLSITKRVNLVSRALTLLCNWILPHGRHNALAMARDMQRFVAVFASCISQSAPHIYLSALPFTPQNSVLSKQYRRDYHKILRIQTGGLNDWPAIQKVLTGHSDSVLSVAFSPNGKCIVSGSVDSAILVSDSETGEVILGPLKGHTSQIRSVAFSPDGHRIVSGSIDKTIRVWDAETGAVVVGPLTGHEGMVFSVAFSPDGRRIVSGSGDGMVWVWDAETGEVVKGPLKWHSPVLSVAFSPDGHRIVLGLKDGVIPVWDVETGEEVVRPLRGHGSSVTSAVFSPDGHRIASGSRDRTILVWNSKTGKVVAGPFEGHSNWITSVAFSPDGRRIVSGSEDETLRVWDAETGEVVMGPLKGHRGWVWSVAFSPDGDRIISCSWDNTIRVWDAGMSEVVVETLEEHASRIWSVAFSPDGCRIVSGSQDEMIRVWDAETGMVVAGPFEGHSEPVTSVAFSPDGNRIVSGSEDDTLLVWDAETGEMVVGPFKGHNHSITSVAFSPNGNRIVSGSQDDSILLWDAETGEAVVGPLKGHNDAVMSVSFSPNGHHVVSGSDDGTILVWDAETGQVVVGPFNGHSYPISYPITSVAFSPNGNRIVAGSEDDTVLLWDAKTGKVVAGPLEGHSDSVLSVAFSPDGRHIVSGSMDKTVRVWDAETGNVVAGPLEGHCDRVTSVAFSPNGYRIVSSSRDKTIRVWEMGRVIAGTLDGHRDLAASPDGHYTISSSEEMQSRMQGSVIRISGSKVQLFNASNKRPSLISAVRHKTYSEMSASFNNSSRMTDDGWLCSSNSKRLFWVPPTLQAGLLRPGSKSVIGGPIVTRLDVSSFVHGESWFLCKTS